MQAVGVVVVVQASAFVAHRPRGFGSQAPELGLHSWVARAYLLCCMRDLPGPGIEPMSPALAGRFFTTEPPGKPSWLHLIAVQSMVWIYYVYRPFCLYDQCPY